MKNLIFFVLLLSIASVGCSSNDKETKLFITDFFTSHAKYTCTDSIKGKVQLRFLHNQVNMEIMSFEFVIPDSIQHSGFYNAYIGRIVDTYYKSLAAQENGNIDSLFLSQSCNVVDVKKNIIDYYSSDEVFSGVFKTALSSYFVNKKDLEKDIKVDIIEKIEFSLDSLIQISLIQFDIVDYDPKRGFAYHFVCGVNPYEYSIQNRVNLLIPGFCQEALRTKEMYDVNVHLIRQLTERVKLEEEFDLDRKKELCEKYQNELHRLLIEDGTLKKSLIDYYEKRKDIEPFILIN